MPALLTPFVVSNLTHSMHTIATVRSSFDAALQLSGISVRCTAIAYNARAEYINRCVSDPEWHYDWDTKLWYYAFFKHQKQNCVRSSKEFQKQLCIMYYTLWIVMLYIVNTENKNISIVLVTWAINDVIHKRCYIINSYQWS